MEYIIYMDMYKKGANNIPETLTAVGGGGKTKKVNLGFKGGF